MEIILNTEEKLTFPDVVILFIMIKSGSNVKVHVEKTCAQGESFNTSTDKV